MSTIQSRTLEKKAKKPCNIDLKISSYPKIQIVAFLKTFPTKMKPTNAQQGKKNEARKVKKRGGEKAKGKVKTAVLSF